MGFTGTVCNVCETLGGGLTQVHPSTATDATCSIGTFLTMQYSWELKWNGPSGWTTVNSGSGQQSNINMDEWGKVLHPGFDGSPGQYQIRYTLTAWVRKLDGQTGGCVGYPYEYCTISGPQPAPVH